jgi:hypothetical protein
MTVFQILAALFGLAMVYMVTIHSKKKTLSTAEASFWYSTWCVFITISLFPFLLNEIAGILKFARIFDLLVVVALMALTTIVIVSYFTQKENKRKLEHLVQEQAVHTYVKNKK